VFPLSSRTRRLRPEAVLSETNRPVRAKKPEPQSAATGCSARLFEGTVPHHGLQARLLVTSASRFGPNSCQIARTCPRGPAKLTRERVDLVSVRFDAHAHCLSSASSQVANSHSRLLPIAYPEQPQLRHPWVNDDPVMLEIELHTPLLHRRRADDNRLDKTRDDHEFI